MQKRAELQGVMRRVAQSLFLFAAGLWATAAPLISATPSFRVVGANPDPWTKIFTSVGMQATDSDKAEIVVAGPDAPEGIASIAEGHILVLEGDGALARRFGIVAGTDSVSVRSLVDVHGPAMKIYWAEPVTLPVSSIPAGFQVFSQERWKKAPLVAGKRTAHGAVLWLAANPGPTGIERFPYLLDALTDLGLSLPMRSTTLWSFFDSAYRSRADVDYLARRWRAAGISALHVAAWHNMEPDHERDEYLRNLIVACHRNAILVYAWLELPHVSEDFWAKHPEWREKTAVGEDAQLDWRKLMNLENADCKRAVSKEVGALLARFDWDGVNLAELYFESLEGIASPARFTPMNGDVRREFQQRAGFDPQRLFDPASPHSAAHDPVGLRTFLDYRAKLASQMQSDWLGVVEQTRAEKPWLAVILTHIDDRLEPGMRDALGADTSRSLPLIEAQHATVLVEDPATLWNLGSARYLRLADKWSSVPLNKDKLAVDINVVERYQDVYPTKKQTGTELLQLVHQASQSFSHVALYFENSIERQDLNLLPVAAANARMKELEPDEFSIEASQPVRIAWKGPAEVDGRPWPLKDAEGVIVPAGTHRLTVGLSDPPVTIGAFNGNVRNVAVDKSTVELSYSNSGRALVSLASPAASIDVDGSPYWKADPADLQMPIVLPAGEHVVSFHR